MVNEGEGVPEHPLASVIIPCRNVATTIGRQLASLASMTNAPEFEIVLVLNGCTDRSREVIEAFAALHPGISIRIEESRAGRCVARNHGAAVARGDVLAFVDGDDTVYPDWLEMIYARTAQLHGIVSGRLVHTRVNPPEVLRVYGISPDEGDPALESDLPLHNLSTFRDACEGNFAVWRDDYLRVGGMDASFKGGLEGTDYCLRSIQAGIPVNTCHKAKVDYWLRGTGTGTFRQQRALARSKLLYFVRHYNRGSSTGASLKYSLYGFLSEIVRLPAYPILSSEQRHKRLHRLGGHLGSLEGHVLYRLLRRVPKRELLSVDDYR